jgi:hypothetical protein
MPKNRKGPSRIRARPKLILNLIGWAGIVSSSAPNQTIDDNNAKEIDMRVEVQFEGELVITGNVAEANLGSLMGLLTNVKVEKRLEPDEPPYSDPITAAQAKELVSRLDTRCVELLRQIALGGGSITWPQVQKICGIKGRNFGQYLDQYHHKINDAVRMVTRGEHRFLITYEDGAPAWETPDWKDAKLEIDGPALMSLKEVFTAQPR